MSETNSDISNPQKNINSKENKVNTSNLNISLVPNQQSIKMEVLQFKDEILREIKMLKKSISEKYESNATLISEKLTTYDSKINILNERITELTSKINTDNNAKTDISSLLEFKNKTRDNLLTMEIKVNNIDREMRNNVFRIDNILSDSVLYPGIIGKSCKFKTFHQMLDHILSQISQTITYREKNTLDLNTYKKKLESLVQNLQSSKDGIVAQNNSLINKKMDEIEEKFKSLISLYDERLSGTRAENAEYIKNMEETMNKFKTGLMEVENLKGKIFEEIKAEGNLLRVENEKTQNIFLGYKKEFNLLKDRFTQLSEFIKDVRFRINLGQEVKKRDFYQMSNKIDFSKKQKIENSNNINITGVYENETNSEFPDFTEDIQQNTKGNNEEHKEIIDNKKTTLFNEDNKTKFKNISFSVNYNKNKKNMKTKKNLINKNDINESNSSVSKNKNTNKVEKKETENNSIIDNNETKSNNKLEKREATISNKVRDNEIKNNNIINNNILLKEFNSREQKMFEEIKEENEEENKNQNQNKDTYVNLINNNKNIVNKINNENRKGNNADNNKNSPKKQINEKKGSITVRSIIGDLKEDIKNCNELNKNDENNNEYKNEKIKEDNEIKEPKDSIINKINPDNNIMDKNKIKINIDNKSENINNIPKNIKLNHNKNANNIHYKKIVNNINNFEKNKDNIIINEEKNNINNELDYNEEANDICNQISQNKNNQKIIFNGIINKKESLLQNEVQNINILSKINFSPISNNNYNNSTGNNIIESKKNSKIYSPQNLRHNISRVQSAINIKLPNLNYNIKHLNKKQQTIRPSSSANNIFRNRNIDNQRMIYDLSDKNANPKSKTIIQNQYFEEDKKAISINNKKKKNKNKNNTNSINSEIYFMPSNAYFKSNKIKANINPNIQALQHGISQFYDNTVYSYKNNQVNDIYKNYINIENKKAALNSTEYNYHKKRNLYERNNEAREIQGMIYNLQGYIKGYNSNFMNLNELREEKKRISKNSSYYKFKEMANENKKNNIDLKHNNKNIIELGFNNYQ